MEKSTACTPNALEIGSTIGGAIATCDVDPLFPRTLGEMSQKKTAK